MLIALGQFNPVVGDVRENAERICTWAGEAGAAGASMLVLPELCLCGYPPRDLLFRSGFVDSCVEAIDIIAHACGSLTVVVGTPWPSPGGRGLFNSAVVVRDGMVVARHDKMLLPGYDVFDEDRYFDPGDKPTIIEHGGKRIGLLICEDLWCGADAGHRDRYTGSPASALADAGCDLIIAPNASPFVIGKGRRHAHLLSGMATTLHCPIAVVNQAGANDDLIFDGRSTFAASSGRLTTLPGFDACLAVVDAGTGSVKSCSRAPGGTAGDDLDDEQRETFLALRCSIRDYVTKTGHRDVLVGLSGGIDSALTAALAAAALGGEHVHGILMPSRYSSPGSLIDARESVKRLAMPEPREIPIETLHRAGEALLGAALPEFGSGLSAENLQSRLRGLILMAVSNETGALVLPTSNKSELAVGYATIYGDMCGALSVLGDLVKSRVVALANWMNAHAPEIGFAAPPIPEASILKPPSAELRTGQLDSDALPAYEVLDEIVERIVDREECPAAVTADIAARGLLHRAEAQRVVRLIDLAEYKRFQSAVIPKVTPRAFGRGRPMPIVARSSPPRLVDPDE